MFSIKIKLMAFSLCCFSISIAQNTPNEARVYEVVPDHLLYLYPQERESIGPDKAYQLITEDKQWENGRILRVCFFRGNPVVAELVRNVASEWNTYSGVALDFGPAGSYYNCLSPSVGFPEIRIGFNDRGYWSNIGNDSEQKADGRAPSMNLDSFNQSYSEWKYTVSNVMANATKDHKATIRHEFGHALGLLHEHQNPELNCYDEIKWEGPDSAYAYYAKPPNKWDTEDVDFNIGLINLSDPNYIAGEPDADSIMMYYLPDAILKMGSASHCATKYNIEISDKDAQIIAKIYPQQSGSVATKISAATFKPVTNFFSDWDKQDYLERTFADIESVNIVTRRNAQARLAQVLQHSATPSDVNKLISELPEKSYQYKLGVAVALGSLENKIKASKPSKEILKQQLRLTNDTMLKENLKDASKNIDSWRQ